MIPTPLHVWTSPTSDLVFVELLVGNKYQMVILTAAGYVYRVEV